MDIFVSFYIKDIDGYEVLIGNRFPWRTYKMMDAFLLQWIRRLKDMKDIIDAISNNDRKKIGKFNNKA